jgi:predicted TIM-barrel fold metal-dependent hydrolase
LIIIDSYCHIGECRIYDQIVFDSELVSSLSMNRVSAVILAPFPGAPNPVQVHDQIANLGIRFPGRVFGLVNANPHTNRDRYHAEAERCVRQLGFVGIVMDTLGHAVNPNGNDAQTVFELGRELGVPIVVHTGSGAPFGLPSAVLPRARGYSDVKIVLAHAGAVNYSQEAQIITRESPNLYLGTSYCRGDDIKSMVTDLGANRVMFASDLPANQAIELSKYRGLSLFQFQQLQAFSQTATDVFGLQGVPDLPDIDLS